MKERPLASIVIATKNRLAELIPAVQSALAQSVPVEVLVMDDGSTDRTADAIRSRFPSVRVCRSEASLGYIVQRNRAAGLVSAEIVFSIDDDAIFTTPDIVKQTLAYFDHPRVGAVAIPYVEPRKSATILQQAPFPEGIFVTDWFIGTAHALRKDLFVRLGGYREFLFHQGEETDYAIRMLDAGHIVRLGHGDVIHHMESPHRDRSRIDYYGRRNDVFFAWCNVPASAALVHALATTARGFVFGFKVGRPWRMTQGLAAGWWVSLTNPAERKPVKAASYRLHRRIKKTGPVRLGDIESELPPLG